MKTLLFLISLFIFLLHYLFAQARNPTEWPYGGEPDESRKEGWMNRFQRADFENARFNILANFQGAKFIYETNFNNAQFLEGADFQDAYFNDLTYFTNTINNGKINLKNARLINGYGNSVLVFDYSWAVVRDTMLLGAPNWRHVQTYDFMLTSFIPAGIINIPSDTLISDEGDTTIAPKRTLSFPGAKIILYAPVDLKIQMEKLEFIELYDKLNYYQKKDIASSLKERSFGTNKAAQFEIDYMFAKSTMYQMVSTGYSTYSIFEPVTWWRFIYNATMGLGYRPFRLIYWALFLVVSYGLFYMLKMPEHIDGYISGNTSAGKRSDENKPALSSIMINCLYFSSMVFFSLRLKQDILTFFNDSEKRIIVSQWLLGFLIYIAFLTLSKAGSILQNLRDFFVG